jgi:hypothetical protein
LANRLPDSVRPLSALNPKRTIAEPQIEDTKEEDPELAVRTFNRLASKAMKWITHA